MIQEVSKVTMKITSEITDRINGIAVRKNIPVADHIILGARSRWMPNPFIVNDAT